MADAAPDSIVVKAIGPLLMGLLGSMIGWLPGGSTGVLGSALTALLTVAGGLGGLAFSLLYRRYLGVLGAGGKRKGTAERNAYDRLRQSLSGGSLATRLYADRLRVFLAAVDRLFGDAGMADRTLFPSAFGLKTPAPLWTPIAFDRCLLFAVIYPVATVGIIWAICGHVGPAEAALGLRPDVPGWQRVLGATLVGFSAFTALWSPPERKIWVKLAWYAVALTAAVPAIAGISELRAIEIAGLAGLVFVGTIFGIANDVVIFGRPDPNYYARAGGVTLLAVIGFSSAFAVGGSLAFSGIISALCILLVVYVAAGLGEAAMKHDRYGVFLALSFPAMLLACFAAARFLSPLENWRTIGELLLFLGLLTLINAPFDWASLGLTRALLRRGLELGGWWPCLLAIVDALIAVGVVVLLALTMVVGVQIFNHLAAHAGGASSLDLDQLLAGIEQQPTAPEYWWVYALLLSTMIPSLVNLMIGGASLMRGVPGLPALLLRFMPAGKAVASFERTWLALVLTVQVFLGALLGTVAQAVLVAGIMFCVMPWIGLGLLELARDLAAFDLPLQTVQRIGEIISLVRAAA